MYYTDWFWYLNWEERFWLKSLHFTMSNLAKDMDMNKATVLLMPKMVDSMQVVLTKYPTETETSIS